MLAITGTTLDVFAGSDTRPQSIEVSGEGIDPVRMLGANGNYEARIALTGAPPASVKVTNVGDQPATAKTANVTDAVTAKAVYDTDLRRLRITATSSDTVVAPTLTATGFGALNANGALNVTKSNGTPPNVTVTSSAGGSVTVPVTLAGGAFAPIPVQAVAGPTQEVLQGRSVTLDASSSSGPIKGYSWEQTGGPAVTLSDSTAIQPTFTAPAVPNGDATLTFVLTVTGSGGPQSSTVTVHVLSAATLPVAKAGADQTVNQDVAVSLDAGLWTDATTYAWKQTGGTAVTLTGANTAKPTFTSPKKGGPLTFQVTATGAGGDATDEVVVTVRDNVLTAAPANVQYIASKREWRVTGTSNVPGPNVTVTVHNGDLSAPAISAPANVDTLGNWSVRVGGPAVNSTGRISIESSGGGKLLNVAVSVK